MTDTCMLIEKIKSSGYRKGFIAAELGISYMSLARKINNQTEFKGSEIGVLQKLLHLEDRDVTAIFCLEK